MIRTLRTTKVDTWTASAGIARRTLANMRREVATYYDPAARAGLLPGDPPRDSEDDTIDQLFQELDYAAEAVRVAERTITRLHAELASQRRTA